MAYNLNTLLSNNDSGGTWTQTSGPFTFTLDSNTGIISNLTIVNGEVTVPTCLSAGTYTFNYSIETCVGSNTFISEDVSIVVDNTINSIANLPTYYICREEGGVGIIKDPNDNVLSTMTIDSPLYLGTCDNSTLTDPVEVFIGSSTTVIVDTTPLTPIQLTWADFNNAFNNATVDPLDIQVCRTYNLESQSSCSEPAEGVIYETPELKSFSTIFSDCVESQPYSVGSFIPDSFINYINDVFPNVGVLGGSLRSPNALGYGTGGCSQGSINIQYSEDQVNWTDFNPFNVNDPNTITPTFDGNGEWNSTLYYRIEFIFPGGIVVCYKESTVTIMSEACCDYCETSLAEAVYQNTTVQSGTSINYNFNSNIVDSCNGNSIETDTLFAQFSIVLPVAPAGDSILEIHTIQNGVQNILTVPNTVNTNNLGNLLNYCNANMTHVSGVSVSGISVRQIVSINATNSSGFDSTSGYVLSSNPSVIIPYEVEVEGTSEFNVQYSGSCGNLARKYKYDDQTDTFIQFLEGLISFDNSNVITLNHDEYTENQTINIPIVEVVDGNTVTDLTCCN